MAERGLFDRDRHARLLPERRDAAEMIAGQAFAARRVIFAALAPKAPAGFFMLTSQSEGTTAQTGLPSTSAISVLSTREAAPRALRRPVGRCSPHPDRSRRHGG